MLTRLRVTPYKTNKLVINIRFLLLNNLFFVLGVMSSQQHHKQRVFGKIDQMVRTAMKIKLLNYLNYS